MFVSMPEGTHKLCAKKNFNKMHRYVFLDFLRVFPISEHYVMFLLLWKWRVFCVCVERRENTSWVYTKKKKKLKNLLKIKSTPKPMPTFWKVRAGRELKTPDLYIRIYVCGLTVWRTGWRVVRHERRGGYSRYLRCLERQAQHVHTVHVAWKTNASRLTTVRLKIIMQVEQYYIISFGLKRTSKSHVVVKPRDSIIQNKNNVNS